jgi:hypothetical protein
MQSETNWCTSVLLLCRAIILVDVDEWYEYIHRVRGQVLCPTEVVPVRVPFLLDVYKSA